MYELLEGVYRNEIQLCANFSFIEGDHTPEAYAQRARDTVAHGFSALKLDPFAHVNYAYGENLSSNNSLTEDEKELALEIVRAVAKAWRATGTDCQGAGQRHAACGQPRGHGTPHGRQRPDPWPQLSGGSVPPFAHPVGCPESHHRHGPPARPARIWNAELRPTLH